MVHITDMVVSDGPAVLAIYQEGIDTGQATFETQAPTWPIWDGKMRPRPRLVAHLEGQVVGWAALSPTSTRTVYAGVCEVSVYVKRTERGQGIGRQLLQALVAAAEAEGIWTLQASIFPENETSLALHVSCGFRVVGRREKMARHRGVWRDTLLLERRSSLIF